jgi:hypothetical protein
VSDQISPRGDAEDVSNEPTIDGTDGADDANSVDDEKFDAAAIIAAMGGTRGLLESSIPGVAFAAVYAFTSSSVYPALWTAVATGIVILFVALAQRRSVQQTIAGFIGIAIAAGIVLLTGQARDFFLFGIWRNAIWMAAHAVSILIGWPLVGLLLGAFTGEGVAWRRDPPRKRAYMLCSLVWVFVFGIRLGVQVPLFRGDEVVELGLVGILLGIPLFALGCYLNYLILKRVPKTVTDDPEDRTEPPHPPIVSPG